MVVDFRFVLKFKIGKQNGNRMKIKIKMGIKIKNDFQNYGRQYCH